MKPRSKSSGSVMIGNEEVFPQQLEVARQVLEVLDGVKGRRSKPLHQRSPVVALQPQQGKTGSMIAIINGFIDLCEARQRTFQVIVLCGLSQTSLADQTRRRLTVYSETDEDGENDLQGAELNIQALATGLARYPGDIQAEGIVISHNTTVLKNKYAALATMRGVDERLILIDEQHLGNNRDGNLDTFLQSCGIKMSEQPHTWSSPHGTKNHVVGVSATPFAHTILSTWFAKSEDHLQGEALFEIVYREPTDEYNGIKKMLANGRLRASEPLFAEGEPSQFLRTVEADFKKACKSQGPGYLVLRATGGTHTKLMGYINKHGRTMEVKTFDGTENNIAQLTEYLGVKPKQPTWVLIRGAMRAGMTLPQKNYIRAWVESTSDNCDAQIQAGLGRACGYGRTKDAYPIYCHLKSAEKAVSFYEGLRTGNVASIPAGVQNSSARKTKVFGFKLMSYPEAKEYCLKSNFNEKRRSHQLQISTIGGNEKTDLADKLLRMRPDSGSTFGFYVDKPASNFPESWKRLIKQHPNWKGKVVVFVPKGDGFASPPNDLQKKKSALKKGSALQRH